MQKFLTTVSSASLIRHAMHKFSVSARLLGAAFALTFGLGFAPSLEAQSLFAPAITVDSAVITNYELDQRERFMALLRTPGDIAEKAREELIDDRLKLAILDEFGIEVDDEEIKQGMTELAGRANLSLEEFLGVLRQNGIAPETVRDLTRVGISWRNFLGARYLSQARPTEEEIDRAMGQAGSGGVQVLLSELIVPINEQNASQVEQFIQQVGKLKSYDAFSSAATQYSAADSRNNGGRLPWMNLTKLPPQLQAVVLELDLGEITEPVPLQGAVALFQMRGLREIVGGTQRYAAIEYAAYYIPGGRSPEALAEGQKIINQVDTCDDFYGIAQGQDPSVLDRQSLVPGEIPRDIGIELAKLDPNETSLTLTRNEGQTLMLLMLCGRTAELGEGQSRETVANALTQQRINSYSQSLLNQLRADARIVEK
ncbi:PPIC-type PPIASE domain [Roseobacter sp. SK209-2-6]|uniref:peptidylprolyl isomerase n=1 Tax=Roseobacter sp. SK209-2-6 TaxID=388739 RepID=UPI0000F3E763|nr:peptidylprolyl isomerase [Roseobacter sp. SK209-2-6]EBA16211.1 PPIC-type PPIASE domain [Roseobacter sp. SK209-2-6]